MHHTYQELQDQLHFSPDQQQQQIHDFLLYFQESSESSLKAHMTNKSYDQQACHLIKKTCCEWTNKEWMNGDQIKNHKDGRKSGQRSVQEWATLLGGGRNPFCEKLEELVLQWVYDRRTKGLRLSRKMIMKKVKVKVMYDEMTKNGEENDSNIDFLASTGWLRNVMVYHCKETILSRKKIQISWLTS